MLLTDYVRDLWSWWLHFRDYLHYPLDDPYLGRVDKVGALEAAKTAAIICVGRCRKY